jgi:hypothetical protein
VVKPGLPGAQLLSSLLRLSFRNRRGREKNGRDNPFRYDLDAKLGAVSIEMDCATVEPDEQTLAVDIHYDPRPNIAMS